MNKLVFKIFTFSFLFLIFSAVFLLAEGSEVESGPAEPDSTDIILPEMYLEIEDLTIEEIDAVIPDDDSVMFLSIETTLPEPEQIKIPAEAFAVDSLKVPGSSEENNADNNTSFYCEGTIGGGTSANITGDINLYHIGQQPDFRLRYFHDGYDGFAGNQAGMGFSSREELIEAEADYTGDALSLKGLLSYNELEDGLQGQADYFTLTRRIADLSTEASWYIVDKLNLSGNLGAGYTGYQLNSLSPLSYNSLDLLPEVVLTYGTEKINFGGQINYKFDWELDNSFNQDLGAGLFFNADFSQYFRIATNAGILWNNFNNFYVPFDIELSGTGSIFDYSVSGGYKCFYYDITELWDIFPAAAGPAVEEALGELPLTRGWFAEGEFTLNPLDILSLFVNADFSYYENAIKPTDSLLTGFNSFSSVDSVCLTLGTGFLWDITNLVSLNMSWSSQILEDMDWYKPRHSLSLGADFISPNEKFGLSGDLAFNIYDEEQTWYYNDWVPVIGFEGYFRISPGFVISLSVDDVLAGVLSSGRHLWGNYLDMGTVAQLKVKISL
ncbi:MAG: hypothetical protein PQJ46_06720 [Spirochaetales bacterium]|nr:hypothetical protein [Spirochaetales bacterium]